MTTQKDQIERVFQRTKRLPKCLTSTIQSELQEIEGLIYVLSDRHFGDFTDAETRQLAALFRPSLFAALTDSTEGYPPHHRGARILLAAELLKANEGTAPVRRDLDGMGSRVDCALDAISALIKVERGGKHD